MAPGSSSAVAPVSASSVTATAQASDFNVSDFDVSDVDVTANLHMRNDFHALRRHGPRARPASISKRLCKRITQSQRHQNPKVATGNLLRGGSLPCCPCE